MIYLVYNLRDEDDLLAFRFLLSSIIAVAKLNGLTSVLCYQSPVISNINFICEQETERKKERGREGDSKRERAQLPLIFSFC